MDVGLGRLQGGQPRKKRRPVLILVLVDVGLGLVESEIVGYDILVS